MIKLFEVTVALILLLVTYAEVAVLELSDKATRELMDFYIKYRVVYDFMKPDDLQKIDIREFNIMCKNPQWVVGSLNLAIQTRLYSLNRTTAL